MDKKQQVKQLTKQAIIGGLYCDSIEDMKHNNLWKQKVKSYSNKLKDAIKIYDNFYMKNIDVNTSQDFVNAYESISNLIDFNLSLSENKMKYFNDDLEKLIKKYQ